MPIPKLPISFPSFVRYPLHAMVYLLLAYFVYKEFTSTDPCKDLRETVAKQDERITDLEAFNRFLIKSNDDFKNALLIKNGVINQVRSKLDSIQTSTQ